MKSYFRLYFICESVKFLFIYRYKKTKNPEWRCHISYFKGVAGGESRQEEISIFKYLGKFKKGNFVEKKSCQGLEVLLLLWLLLSPLPSSPHHVCFFQDTVLASETDAFLTLLFESRNDSQISCSFPHLDVYWLCEFYIVKVCNADNFCGAWLLSVFIVNSLTMGSRSCLLHLLPQPSVSFYPQRRCMSFICQWLFSVVVVDYSVLMPLFPF